MPRSPYPPAVRRSAIAYFRMRPAEVAAVRRAANRREQNISEWLRAAVQHALDCDRDPGKAA
jgi:hypothetical protein